MWVSRLAGVLDMVKQEVPAVAVFQEVTEKQWRAVLGTRGVQEHCWVSCTAEQISHTGSRVGPCPYAVTVQ